MSYLADAFLMEAARKTFCDFIYLFILLMFQLDVFWTTIFGFEMNTGALLRLAPWILESVRFRNPSRFKPR